MNYASCLFFLGIFAFICCDTKGTVEEWKKEITDAERSFAQLAGEEGIPTAFLTFAAEDVVVKKNKSVLVGKEALKKWYESQPFTTDKVSLLWDPDFVDVSSCGDLGYTYGHYTYARTDTSGVVLRDTGIFHTVWKRQPDGEWKFVWD